jgi:hypothetical protein
MTFTQIEESSHVKSCFITFSLGLGRCVKDLGSKCPCLGKLTLQLPSCKPIVLAIFARNVPKPATAICCPRSLALLEPKRQKYLRVTFYIAVEKNLRKAVEADLRNGAASFKEAAHNIGPEEVISFIKYT